MPAVPGHWDGQDGHAPLSEPVGLDPVPHSDIGASSSGGRGRGGAGGVRAEAQGGRGRGAPCSVLGSYRPCPQQPCSDQAVLKASDSPLKYK